MNLVYDKAWDVITTIYLGPSTTKKARVRASFYAGSITLVWDQGLNSQENHIRAAKALAKKFAIFGDWASGSINRGMVFVKIGRGTTCEEG